MKLPRFRHLSTTLGALYAALFTLAFAITAIMAQGLIASHARESVRSEMIAAGRVYDRIWAMKARSLRESADLLSHDFGFRAAVASGDQATIVSALDNIRKRAGVADALVVDLEGEVTGHPGALAQAVASIPFALPADRRETVISVGRDVYRLIISPVMAPVRIGWVIFAVRLDAQEMRSLEQLSAVPLNATVLRRLANGRWQATDNTLPVTPVIDELVARSNDLKTLRTISLPDGEAYALSKRLAGINDQAVAAIVIRYPMKAAFAPYRPLKTGLALAGVISLVLVLFASRRLAAGIARPIAALGRAARKLEEGDRTEVLVVGNDEIARLAESFNRMSAGIVEREHRISHLAFHDALTGLPNRFFFRQQLEQALTSAGTAPQVAVLCLDLDGFKGVNDTLGHPVGDALLNIVGTMLVDQCDGAFVSRLGGDEFAIILHGRFDADRPRALAQRIIDRMRDPFAADGHQIATATSIGIALGPVDGADADQLLKNADLALYRAKQDGRGIARFFEPGLDAAARQRRQMELDLRDAIHDGQFTLNYQPIFDLKADRIGGFEALLRWKHPERGFISPVDFIPVAEDTGLIIAIGEWVMHEACRQAINWPEHIRVAVNVSPLQFRNQGLQAIIMQALGRSGLAPNRLEVEITESVFLDGEGPTIALLHRLREMGIRIALDDFGTGYSSLSYLRSFPFDKIKIDRSFVTSVAQDPGAAAIVQAIVDLANALHMDTTAEGVEENCQLDQLKLQGCSSIQGYLFSRPISGERVDELLHKAASRAA